jgi:hypothetical protein
MTKSNWWAIRSVSSVKKKRYKFYECDIAVCLGIVGRAIGANSIPATFSFFFVNSSISTFLRISNDMQLYGSFCYGACFEGKLIRAGSKQEKPRNRAKIVLAPRQAGTMQTFF